MIESRGGAMIGTVRTLPSWVPARPLIALVAVVAACGLSSGSLVMQTAVQKPYSYQRGHTRDVTFVGWAPDSRTLFSFAAADGSARVWDADLGTVVTSGRYSGETGFVVESSSRELMLTVHPTGDLIFRNQKGTWNWRVPGSDSVRFALSPDGMWSAEAENRGQPALAIREVATGRLLRRLEGHPGIVNGVKYSTDGRFIASANGDRTVALWSAETGQVLSVLGGHEDGVNVVAVSPDGRWVAAGSADLTVRVWNVASGSVEAIFRGHTLPVRAVAFVSSTELVSGGDDRTVRLWSVAQNRLLKSIAIPGWRGSQNARTCCGSPIIMLEQNPMSGTVAIGCADGYGYLWDPQSGDFKEVMSLSDGVLPRHSVRFDSVGGWRWVVGSTDPRVVVHTPVSSTTYDLGRVRGSFGAVTAVAAGAENWVTAMLDGEVELWDLRWAQRRRLFKTSGEVLALAVSPNGETVVAGGEDQTIQVWSLKTGQRLWAAHTSRE